MINVTKRSRKRQVIGVLLFMSLCLLAYLAIDQVFVLGPQRSSAFCAQNLKQIGLAFAEYEQDYDQAAPNGNQNCRIGAKFEPDGLGWAQQIYLYDRQERQFRCPDDHTPDDPALGEVVSYAYNYNLARNARIYNWVEPANTVQLFEVSGAHAKIDPLDSSPSNVSPPYSPAGDGTMLLLLDGLIPRNVRPATGDVGKRPGVFDNIPWPEPRHGVTAGGPAGAIYLFADGHVSWMPPDQVSSGSDAKHSDSAQTGGVTGHAAGTGNTQYMATFSVN